MDENKINFKLVIDDFREYIDMLDKDIKEMKENKQKLLLDLQDIILSEHECLKIKINHKNFPKYNDILFRNFIYMGAIIEYLIKENIRNRELISAGMKSNFVLLMEVKNLKNTEIEDMSKEIKETMKEYEEDAPFIKDLKAYTEEIIKRQNESKNYQGIEYE